MAGKPTTMIPLQKLEKSCRPLSWVITMIVRLVERTDCDIPDDTFASNAGLSQDGAERGTVPVSNSSVCNSRPVVVVILRKDWRMKCSGEI